MTISKISTNGCHLA